MTGFFIISIVLGAFIGVCPIFVADNIKRCAAGNGAVREKAGRRAGNWIYALILAAVLWSVATTFEVAKGLYDGHKELEARVDSLETRR